MPSVVTTDFGKSFRSIANNLPTGSADQVHVIREDPYNRDLLFVGTDAGGSLPHGLVAAEVAEEDKRSRRKASVEDAAWLMITLSDNTANNGGGVGIGYSQHSGQVTVADGTKRVLGFLKAAPQPQYRALVDEILGF